MVNKVEPPLGNLSNRLPPELHVLAVDCQSGVDKASNGRGSTLLIWGGCTLHLDRAILHTKTFTFIFLDNKRFSKLLERTDRLLVRLNGSDGNVGDGLSATNGVSLA